MRERKEKKRNRKQRCGLAIVLIAVAMLMCLLSACSREETSTVQTVTRDGKVYTIDQSAETISDGTYSYHFQVSRSGGSSVHYEFFYPDGSRFYWTQEKNGGYGGWSDDYNKEAYADGHTLLAILNAKTSVKKEAKPVGLSIVLFLCGLFNAITPETAWYLSDGWKFKNSEPSDSALQLTRFAGIAAMVLAVCLVV